MKYPDPDLEHDQNYGECRC